MRRIAVAAISVLAMLLIAVGASAQHDVHAPTECPPRHSHLIFADGQAEVYFARESFGDVVIRGCAYGHRRSFILVRCGGEETDAACARTMTLAGPIAAYEQGEWFVVVRDLRTGRVLHRVPTGTPLVPKPGYNGIGNIVAIVLKSEGAVAWIADDYERTTGVVTLSETPYFDVEAIDKSGSRLLASGSDIDPSSLALSVGATNIGYHGTALEGNTVLWIQGGKPASASLN
jgi:hypothetical protein